MTESIESLPSKAIRQDLRQQQPMKINSPGMPFLFLARKATARCAHNPRKRTHLRDGRRQFKPIPEHADAFGRVEAVDVGDGVKVHYLYDPTYPDGSHNKSISGSLTSSVSTAAAVFQGEMYDVRKGRKWTADAPDFGIPFGARHISIHIELPF